MEGVIACRRQLLRFFEAIKAVLAAVCCSILAVNSIDFATSVGLR